MPPLDNARRERFCQELLIDENATQAYIRAGYSEKGAKVSASRLLADANVAARVAELRAGLGERLEITQESVLREIDETRKAAATDGQHAVALKASELKGKHIGMWPQKQVDASAADTFLRLLAEIAQERLDRQTKTIEHEPQ